MRDAFTLLRHHGQRGQTRGALTPLKTDPTEADDSRNRLQPSCSTTALQKHLFFFFYQKLSRAFMNLAGNPMNAKECGEATAFKSEPSWPICCRKTTTEAGNNGSQRLSFSLFYAAELYRHRQHKLHTHTWMRTLQRQLGCLFLKELCVKSSDVL